MVEINGEVYYFYEDEDDARQGQMAKRENGQTYYLGENGIRIEDL